MKAYCVALVLSLAFQGVLAAALAAARGEQLADLGVLVTLLTDVTQQFMVSTLLFWIAGFHWLESAP